MEQSFEAIKKTIKKLPIKAKEKLLTGATRAAANVIRDEAKQNVPIDTGLLKRSIKTVKGRPKYNGLYEIKYFVVVKPKIKWVEDKTNQKGSAFYANMIEYGTIHMAAQPFMRPAFDNADDRSIRAAHAYVFKNFTKVLK
jgi:HK97 gp10 family phage protein